MRVLRTIRLGVLLLGFVLTLALGAPAVGLPASSGARPAVGAAANTHALAARVGGRAGATPSARAVRMALVASQQAGPTSSATPAAPAKVRPVGQRVSA